MAAAIRLRRLRRGLLHLRQDIQGTLVADLAERDRGVVLQRTVEFGDGRERLEGVLRLEIASASMTAVRKKSWPRPASRTST